ncbi:hypothetical protein O6H91_08G068900 [Diphasiastrum complanatum]|uniref:Uncharacterized protein n=1 Tax=Diphasiastrum complanatum TaxID=34168 RepID=A0ACC2CYI6_DIPCM|nr:hypothetical protein O6H91_08G068900 [Diphasiastrum complanatum]
MELYPAAASSLTAADEEQQLNYQRRDVGSSCLPTITRRFSSRPLVTSANYITAAPDHEHEHANKKPQTRVQMIMNQPLAGGKDHLCLLSALTDTIMSNPSNVLGKLGNSQRPNEHVVIGNHCNDCHEIHSSADREASPSAVTSGLSQPNIELASSGAEAGYKYLHLKPRAFTEIGLRRTKSASGNYSFMSNSLGDPSVASVLQFKQEEISDKPKLCSRKEDMDNEVLHPLRKEYPGSIESISQNFCKGHGASRNQVVKEPARQAIASKFFCCLPLGRKRSSRP